MTVMAYWINEIALWLSAFVYAQTMERREKFGIRVLAATGSYLILTAVMNQLLMREIIDPDIVARLFWYLVLAGFLYTCWNISVSVALYYALWGFMSWQLLYEMWIMLRMKLNISISSYGAAGLGSILVFFVGYTIAYVSFARWMPEGCKKIGPRQLSSGLLIFWIFEIVGIAQRKLDITAADSRWELLYLTQVLIAVMLYLQNEMFKKSALRQEIALMNLLHKKEQEQYRLSKENIELINQKCHDLKHQIRMLRNQDWEDKDKFLEEIEDSIHIYEAIVKTGNEVLDTILTEKSLYCRNHGITVSCVADGIQMDFIQPIDLYSLLGNAMDNAIEAVEKLKEQERRQIDVVIYRQQKFLIMNIMNPISESLKYDGDDLITTKGDRNYHGFGVKSMKYIVEKYDGCLNIEETDGCFSLKILIPIPPTT